MTVSEQNWGKWFVSEFVLPTLNEPDALRTLGRLREWINPSDGITPKPFEGWLHTALAVRIEEAGFRILINASENIRPCNEDGHAKAWSPDIWIKENERLERPVNVFLKTQFVAPQECKRDITKMEHLAKKHKSPGVFVCVAIRPRIEHPKRWQKFDQEVERKSREWGCDIEDHAQPWIRVLWRGKD